MHMRSCRRRRSRPLRGAPVLQPAADTASAALGCGAGSAQRSAGRLGPAAAAAAQARGPRSAVAAIAGHRIGRGRPGRSRRLPARITLQGQIPLQKLAQTTLQVDLQQVDLRPLMTSLPRTAFTGPLTVKPWQQGWQLQADIRNALPGPLDQERAPLDRLLADLRMAPEQWQHRDAASCRSAMVARRCSAVTCRSRRRLICAANCSACRCGGSTARWRTTSASQLVRQRSAVAGTLQQGLAFTADMASDAAGTREAARPVGNPLLPDQGQAGRRPG